MQRLIRYGGGYGTEARTYTVYGGGYGDGYGMEANTVRRRIRYGGEYGIRY